MKRSVFLFLLLFTTLATAQELSSYVDPFDGKLYPGMQAYHPQNPKDAKKSGPHIENIMLLTDQNIMASRISVEDLSAYLKSTESGFQKVTINTQTSFYMIARFEISPRSKDIRVLGSPEVGEALISSFKSELQSLPAPKVADPVAFIVYFTYKP